MLVCTPAPPLQGGWGDSPSPFYEGGREGLGPTENGSLLKSFTLDRSVGASYNIEGVVRLTDGYADDNNRVGI